MCGRYTIRNLSDVAHEVIGNDAKLDDFEQYRFSLSPGRPVPIVRAAGDGRDLATPVWGLVSHTAEAKPKFAPINAKSETVASNFLLRHAFNERRCLLPCDGFYEPKGPGTLKKRQPYFFRRPGDKPFALAGIWEPPSKASSETCTMLTTTPNAVLKPIHDRMPVVVLKIDWSRWLDPDLTGEDVADLLRPAPDDYLETWPVLDMVEDPESNGGYRDGVPAEWR